jgi:hypothetical protein
MDLFLDTNVYLSFYKLSDDDLEELQKLAVAVRSKDTILYVTDQVRDEFNRNRESIVAESLKALEAAKLPAGFPRLFMNFPEYEELRTALSSYDKHRNALLEKVRKAASDKDLHADRLIAELFKIANHAPMTSEIWTAAKMRFDLGNPPGKDDSYGDAINWESLLATVPDGRDLLIVTADTDFISKLDPSLLAEVLRNEWADRKMSSVSLYRNLTSLFRHNYPDIKLASELEKELKIDALVGSLNFQGTHSAIEDLDEYADFSPGQALALIDAAINNDQIHRIYDDDDVYEFFIQVAIDHEEDLDPEMWEAFWAIFNR